MHHIVEPVALELSDLFLKLRKAQELIPLNIIIGAELWENWEKFVCYFEGLTFNHKFDKNREKTFKKSWYYLQKDKKRKLDHFPVCLSHVSSQLIFKPDKHASLNLISWKQAMAENTA